MHCAKSIKRRNEVYPYGKHLCLRDCGGVQLILVGTCSPVWNASMFERWGDQLTVVGTC